MTDEDQRQTHGDEGSCMKCWDKIFFKKKGVGGGTMVVGTHPPFRLKQSFLSEMSVSLPHSLVSVLVFSLLSLVSLC